MSVAVNIFGYCIGMAILYCIINYGSIYIYNWFNINVDIKIIVILKILSIVLPAFFELKYIFDDFIFWNFKLERRYKKTYK